MDALFNEAALNRVHASSRTEKEDASIVVAPSPFKMGGVSQDMLRRLLDIKHMKDVAKLHANELALEPRDMVSFAGEVFLISGYSNGTSTADKDGHWMDTIDGPTFILPAGEKGGTGQARIVLDDGDAHAMYYLFGPWHALKKIDKGAFVFVSGCQVKTFGSDLVGTVHPKNGSLYRIIIVTSEEVRKGQLGLELEELAKVQQSVGRDRLMAIIACANEAAKEARLWA